jgi:hypothetical protein
MTTIAKRFAYVAILWAVVFLMLIPFAPFISLFPEGSVFFWFLQKGLSTDKASYRLVRYVWIGYGMVTAFTVVYRRTFFLGFLVLSLLLLFNVVGCWVILSSIHD